MEESLSSSSSSSSSTAPLHPLSYWDCLDLFLLRPFLAISFVFSFILLGWFLAWKLVLVHVPLVQEIFGLRKNRFEIVYPDRLSNSRMREAIRLVRSLCLTRMRNLRNLCRRHADIPHPISKGVNRSERLKIVRFVDQHS
ncbi:hypothetical protein NL676_027684 [Syzygium grande]|nr:hypothetical protein NL676_027684 [Syzygium grande]